MAGRLHDYEKLLRQLSLRAEPTDHMLIEKVLEKVGRGLFELEQTSALYVDRYAGVDLGRRRFTFDAEFGETERSSDGVRRWGKSCSG